MNKGTNTSIQHLIGLTKCSYGGTTSNLSLFAVCQPEAADRHSDFGKPGSLPFFAA